MSGPLSIVLDTGLEALRPGDPVTGHVRAAYATQVRTLRLRLELVERTRDVVHVARRAGEVVLAQGPLVEVVEVQFSVVLPADAQPASDAQPHGRVGWELRAWADVPGRDPDVVLPLLVAARPG